MPFTKRKCFFQSFNEHIHYHVTPISDVLCCTVGLRALVALWYFVVTVAMTVSRQVNGWTGTHWKHHLFPWSRTDGQKVDPWSQTEFCTNQQSLKSVAQIGPGTFTALLLPVVAVLFGFQPSYSFLTVFIHLFSTLVNLVVFKCAFKRHVTTLESKQTQTDLFGTSIKNFKYRLQFRQNTQWIFTKESIFTSMFSFRSVCCPDAADHRLHSPLFIWI